MKRIIDINLKNPSLRAIKQAAKVLKTGGLLVYPTDTAYGLGANALDEEAIRKMYGVKGRDFSKPTHVVVRDWKMIEELTHTNKNARVLYDAFLPGPITLILNKKQRVSDVLTADLPTIGVRIPNNQITKLLSNQLPFPYTTPSANKSGGQTPYSVDEVKKELDVLKIELILNAGKLPKVKPSTIIDLTEDEVKILRHGPVLQADIERALNF